MTTLEQVLKILKHRHDRLESMLTGLGWPLPGHLGAMWLDEVADLYHVGRLTDEDVADSFLSKYQEHGLKDIRRDWKQNTLIAPRLPILLDALTAHEEARYTLSVPVLLAQLEGIVAVAKGHKGRFTGRTLVEYLEPIQDKGSRFQKIAAHLVVETLWSDFYHGERIPKLSRHAILHGADVHYATAGNSLRAILYFDNIREALNTLEIK